MHPHELRNRRTGRRIIADEVEAEQIRKNRRVSRRLAARADHVRPVHSDEALDNASLKAYEVTRVYHGTHHENATGVLANGLKPQGGEGLSGLIGDRRRGAGHVFYSRNKAQAAAFAKGLAGITKHERLRAARNANDPDEATENVFANPPEPRILRAIVPRSVQRNARPDEKGGDDDYMVPAEIPAGAMLPGHDQPEVDMTMRPEAISTFQQELEHQGVGVSGTHAGWLLAHRRRHSVAGDAEVLDGPYATSTARDYVARHNHMNPF